MNKPMFILAEYPVPGRWSIMRRDVAGIYQPNSTFHTALTKATAEDIFNRDFRLSHPATSGAYF